MCIFLQSSVCGYYKPHIPTTRHTAHLLEIQHETKYTRRKIKTITGLVCGQIARLSSPHPLTVGQVRM